MNTSKDYSRGYDAGRKRAKVDIENLKAELAMLKRQKDNERKERLYFRSLSVALRDCDAWKINGKSASCIEDYSSLAEIIMQSATKVLPKP